MNSVQFNPSLSRLPLAKRPQANTTAPLRFGADNWFERGNQGRTSKFSPFDWAKVGVIGLAGLSGLVVAASNKVGQYADNLGSTRSVVFSNYSASGFRTDSDGSITVKGPGFYWYGFGEENMPFDTRPQMIRDTFQPFTQDGVKVDGTGEKADEGIDVLVIFGVDGGPKQTKDAQTGNMRDLTEDERNTYYKKSLPVLASVVVGDSKFDEEAMKRPAMVSETDDLTPQLGRTMRMLYLTKVAPKIQEALNIATTRKNAGDIHEQRDFLEGLLLRGYSATFTDADGKEVSHQLIEPLADQLAKDGLRLELLQLNKVDSPSFLATLNAQRADISMKKRNFLLEIPRLGAEEKQKVSAKQAEFASAIQKQTGDNARNLESALGRVQTEKQKAKKLEQEGLGLKAQKVANATEDAKTTISGAQQEAATIRQKANVYKSEQEAVAAKAEAEILAPAKADAETKMNLGEQLRSHPEFLEKLRIAAETKNKSEMARIIRSMLLAPGTSPIEALKTVTPDLVKPNLPVTPPAQK